MRLVACPSCQAQYDVEALAGRPLHCRCGTDVDTTPRRAVDAAILRCASCGALVGPDAERCEYCTAAIVRDVHRLSLICPGCYAGNEESARYCAACGLEFRPQPLPGTEPDLDCVDCSTRLVPRSVGGVFVHECPQCQGLWAAGNVFADLVDRAIASRREAVTGRLSAPKPRVTSGNPVAVKVKYRKCPVCGELMARRNFHRTSGVIVDRCRAHGTWLDVNELEQIAGFVLSGGLERAPADPASSAPHATGPAASQATSEFTRLLMESGRPLAPRSGSFLEFLRLALTRYW